MRVVISSHPAKCRGCHTVHENQIEAGLCCLLDPRDIRVAGNGVSVRAKGDWCLWCGETIQDGQSFCNKACSNDYHADVGHWARTSCVPMNDPVSRPQALWTKEQEP